MVCFRFRPQLLLPLALLGASLVSDLIHLYWSLDLLNSQSCFVLNQVHVLAQTPLPVYLSCALQEMLDPPPFTVTLGGRTLTWDPMLFP